MSSRTTYKSYVPKLSTVPIHAFENGSDARSISTGFSVNKSTVGLFVVTNVICDIRRLEVDDVIVSVDGRVLSPEDALKDVVCMLEEPISTFAQLTLLKYSDGISGVQRKSVQFLRIRGMFGLQRDLKVECPSDFHDSDGHFKSLSSRKWTARKVLMEYSIMLYQILRIYMMLTWTVSQNIRMRVRVTALFTAQSFSKVPV